MGIILCHPELSQRERWAKSLAGLSTEMYYTASAHELVSAIHGTGSKLAIAHNSCVAPDGVVELVRHYPDCRLMLLADRPDDTEGMHYLKAGAVGYSNTYIAPERLLQAAKVVESGSVWVGQSLMHALIGRAATGVVRETDAPPSHVLDGLTEREAELAWLIAQGKSNKQIARQLDITERTVKAHLNAIYRKTGTSGRLPLALLINKSSTAALM